AEEIIKNFHSIPQYLADLKQTALTVVEDGGEEIAAITCPGALSQILTNLVMNSIFHGFDEGQPGTLRITVADCGEEVEIRYADDGKGIPRENLKRVFEPFFTTRREAGGSGLGLHIIYNLATRTLGGSLKLESEPGHGMAITLRFPKAGRADNDIQEEGERDGGEAGLRAAPEERA
ncbi:MAG: ATP-binding protein, partial [Rhodospirillales bacterium]|nr:ATP-binding protein [Rhodospirillales bacterium]